MRAGPLKRSRTAWLSHAPVPLAAVAYGLVVAVVYLTTPYDMAWHVKTSSARTALPLFGIWLAGVVGLAAGDEIG